MNAQPEARTKKRRGVWVELLVIAATLPIVAWLTGPASTDMGSRFLPRLDDGWQHMSPAALVAVPIVGGCLSRASVFAVGACTIVVFPVHTLASGIVNGSWGNLWPIELATQAALAVGCMVLAGIGRWARRKMGRSGG